MPRIFPARLFALRLLRARDGAAAVEFALMAPVFFALLLGCIEFGHYFWVRNTVQYAAEEAARFAMVSNAGDGEIGARARARATGLDPDSLIVNVSREVAGGVTYVVIDAHYDWPLDAFSGFFPADLRTASGRARAPLIK